MLSKQRCTNRRTHKNKTWKTVWSNIYIFVTQHYRRQCLYLKKIHHAYTSAKQDSNRYTHGMFYSCKVHSQLVQMRHPLIFNNVIYEFDPTYLQSSKSLALGACIWIEKMIHHTYTSPKQDSNRYTQSMLYSSKVHSHLVQMRHPLIFNNVIRVFDPR